MTAVTIRETAFNGIENNDQLLGWAKSLIRIVKNIETDLVSDEHLRLFGLDPKEKPALPGMPEYDGSSMGVSEEKRYRMVNSGYLPVGSISMQAPKDYRWEYYEDIGADGVDRVLNEYDRITKLRSYKKKNARYRNLIYHIGLGAARLNSKLMRMGYN